MSHLIGGVMAVLLVTLGLRVAAGRDPLWLALVSVPLAMVPILLALLRTVPNAVRLGERLGSPAEQTGRAHAICMDHVLCIACLVVFVGLWLAVAATSASS